MRTTFIQTLIELAEQDDTIWLLCGDLGYSVLEPFAARFPDRYLNVGVAEQNMIGIAAGLALSGKQVFCYSIANFPIMRCLEQIRNDVCYHNLAVRIVAVGGGLAYGAAGYTHHAVEDIGVMRILPNMTVLAPGDPVETALAVRAIVRHHGPCYLRLGKANEPTVHSTAPNFEIGKAILVRPGSDVTLIATGGALALTVAAAARLEEQGYSARVLSMPSVTPLDTAAVDLAAIETRGIITVEEHGRGGLGAEIAEHLAQYGPQTRFSPIHLAQLPPGAVGAQDYLRTQGGVSAGAIIERARMMVNLPASAPSP